MRGHALTLWSHLIWEQWFQMEFLEGKITRAEKAKMRICWGGDWLLHWIKGIDWIYSMYKTYYMDIMVSQYMHLQIRCWGQECAVCNTVFECLLFGSRLKNLFVVYLSPLMELSSIPAVSALKIIPRNHNPWNWKRLQRKAQWFEHRCV